MIDSTVLCAVVDECAAGSSELVVEGDGCCEAEQALQDALAQAGEGPGAVTLEGEGVLAAPEDALDSLAYRCEVWASAGLVFAAGSDDRGVQLADLLSELAPGVALIVDQGLSAVAPTTLEELQGDLALVALGGCQGERPGCAVGGEDRVQPETPEEPGMAGAIPVVGGISELGTLDRLAAAGAFHRGRVDEQQIVVESGALGCEDLHQPLQRVREFAPPLEVAGLSRQPREQAAQALGSDRQKPAVGRDAHDRLGDAERDDLRVCDASLGVPRPLGQEIVSRDINGSEQQVEVGVHRGPLWSAMLQSTADFDPAAYKPARSTANAVESII